MKYRIGQKVVYIGPDAKYHILVLLYGYNIPEPKVVYTIRGGVDLHPCVNEPAYLLEEISNPVTECPGHGWRGELHIDEKYLRPVTDISRFHEIRKAVEAGDLRPIRDKVRA
jgi:hypothetical protein